LPDSEIFFSHGRTVRENIRIAQQQFRKSIRTCRTLGRHVLDPPKSGALIALYFIAAVRCYSYSAFPYIKSHPINHMTSPYLTDMKGQSLIVSGFPASPQILVFSVIETAMSGSASPRFITV
jgi:hypothetical protein